ERPSRRLELRIDAIDGHRRLSVRDTGTRIAAENLTSIFDPYFTTKPVGDGYGLCLAVSYENIHGLARPQIAQNHAHGALFSFRLPNDFLLS
ncbi:ATP-binding protein, partial [Pseudomonas syringae group genomosp. 7]|uniref:ATP-binding protein n=1 Tax=Pseudomonas syringae group genomosp. 7 TaxID=251699 RepID=UPI00376FD92F